MKTTRHSSACHSPATCYYPSIRRLPVISRLCALLLVLLLASALLPSMAFADGDAQTLPDGEVQTPATDTAQDLNEANPPVSVNQTPDSRQPAGAESPSLSFVATAVITDETGAIVTAFAPGHTYTYHVSIYNDGPTNVQVTAISVTPPEDMAISSANALRYSLVIYGNKNFQRFTTLPVYAARDYDKVECAYVAGSACLHTPRQPSGINLSDLELFSDLGTTAGFYDDWSFAPGRDNTHELVFQVSTAPIAAKRDTIEGVANTLAILILIGVLFNVVYIPIKVSSINSKLESIILLLGSDGRICSRLDRVIDKTAKVADNTGDLIKVGVANGEKLGDIQGNVVDIAADADLIEQNIDSVNKIAEHISKIDKIADATEAPRPNLEPKPSETSSAAEGASEGPEQN